MKDFTPILITDRTTGLPKLPDGYYFRVGRDTYKVRDIFGDVVAKYKYFDIKIMKSHRWCFGLVQFSTTHSDSWILDDDGKKIDDIDELDESRVAQAAETLATSFYKRQHERERTTASSPILGDYPPNSIGQ